MFKNNYGCLLSNENGVQEASICQPNKVKVLFIATLSKIPNIGIVPTDLLQPELVCWDII
jgi:hypothetical protein